MNDNSKAYLDGFSNGLKDILEAEIAGIDAIIEKGNKLEEYVDLNTNVCAERTDTEETLIVNVSEIMNCLYSAKSSIESAICSCNEFINVLDCIETNN